MEHPDTTALAEYVRGYARLARLPHSPERLKELEPEIGALFEDMAKLWAIPLDGVRNGGQLCGRAARR